MMHVHCKYSYFKLAVRKMSWAEAIELLNHFASKAIDNLILNNEEEGLQSRMH